MCSPLGDIAVVTLPGRVHSALFHRYLLSMDFPYVHSTPCRLHDHGLCKGYAQGSGVRVLSKVLSWRVAGHDLLASIDGRPGLVRPTPHVRIAPARLAGEPHLESTRIGTLSLLALDEDGYTPDSIARLYDLPIAYVTEALDYEWSLAA